MAVTTYKKSCPIGYICAVQGTMQEVIDELATGTDIGADYRLLRLEDVMSPPFYNGTDITCVYLRPDV